MILLVFNDEFAGFRQVGGGFFTVAEHQEHRPAPLEWFHIIRDVVFAGFRSPEQQG